MEPCGVTVDLIVTQFGPYRILYETDPGIRHIHGMFPKTNSNANMTQQLIALLVNLSNSGAWFYYLQCHRSR